MSKSIQPASAWAADDPGLEDKLSPDVRVGKAPVEAMETAGEGTPPGSAELPRT